MTAAAEETQAGVAVLGVAEVTGEEFLAEFAQVMHDWGHCRTAEGLRFPTLAEARQAALGRRRDRGWNTSPIP
jgi:hypothetical protein